MNSPVLYFTPHMNCPECNSDTVAASGACLVCGFRVNGDVRPSNSTDRPKHGAPEGMIEVGYRASPESPEDESGDQPEWRRELSRRLQEIKARRVGETAKEPVIASTPPPSIEPKPPKPASPPPKVVPETPKPRSAPAATAKRSRPAAPSDARKHASAPLPLFEKLEQRPARRPDPGEITLRHSAPSTDTGDAPARSPFDQLAARLPEETAPAGRGTGRESHPSADKLILLSRTLAGLVDMVVILLCTGGYVVAADVVAGMDLFDGVTAIHYSLLWLTTYLLYSLFFLGTANQTIGMMITELRIVDDQGRRPMFRQVLSRAAAYLPALLFIGAGLIWGFFDRQGRCLHDSLSGTRVVRI